MKNEQQGRSPAHRSGDSRSPANSRRLTLTRLAAGGAAVGGAAVLPSRWLRPVVESVLLPAHAQTSGPEDGDFFIELGGDDTFGIVSTRISGRGPSPRPWWLAWMIAPAQALEVQCSLCGICARLRNGKVTVTVVRYQTATDDVFCYEGEAPVGGTVVFNDHPEASGCTTPGPMDVVSVDGVAPARTLVLRSNGEEAAFYEDPSRTCACNGLACVE
ncbi:MAG TPA: hypothetical protein VK973_05085 [Arenicellales bacterium]|nr:hypothetical protein [Arenicellales bacterium]